MVRCMYQLSEELGDGVMSIREVAARFSFNPGTDVLDRLSFDVALTTLMLRHKHGKARRIAASMAFVKRHRRAQARVIRRVIRRAKRDRIPYKQARIKLGYLTWHEQLTRRPTSDHADMIDAFSYAVGSAIKTGVQKATHRAAVRASFGSRWAAALGLNIPEFPP